MEEQYAEYVDQAIDTLLEHPGDRYTAPELLNMIDGEPDIDASVFEERLSEQIDQEDDTLHYEDRLDRFPGSQNRYFQKEFQEQAGLRSGRRGWVPTPDLRQQDDPDLPYSV